MIQMASDADHKVIILDSISIRMGDPKDEKEKDPTVLGGAYAVGFYPGTQSVYFKAVALGVDTVSKMKETNKKPHA